MAIAGSMLPAAPASAATGSGWTAPTKPSADYFPADFVAASSSGAAYSGQGGLFYRPTGASTDTVVDNSIGAKISGSSLIFSHIVNNTRVLTYVDLASGSVFNRSGGVAANLGGAALDSACCTSPTNFVLHHADGTDDAWSIPVGFVYGEAGSDANGFAFWSANASNTTYTMYYYDLTTRSYRSLFAGDGNPRGVTVTAHDIVWLANGVVFRTPRTGGAVAQSQPPAGTTDVTATDRVTAFLANGSVILRTAAGDTTASMPRARSITTDGSNVVAGTAGDVPSAGIYQINPAGQAQELFPLHPKPYSMWPFTFSLGRLTYTDNSRTGTLWFARSVSGDPSRVDVGEERSAGSLAGGSLVSSGDRVAYSYAASGKYHVAVRRNGRVERDVVVPDRALLQMSGPRVVMSADSPRNGWWAKVLDVTTGEVTSLSICRCPEDPVVWGPLLVWMDGKDRMWVRDLTRPTSKSNPRVLMTQQRAGGYIWSPLVWGDWVSWTSRRGITVLNTRTAETFTVSGSHGQLADGTFAWDRSTASSANENSFECDVIRLTGSDRSPIALGAKVAGATVVEDKFAWTEMRYDMTSPVVAHIDELPFNATDVPRALYLTPKRSFTPNGKRRYVVELDSTKALSSWAIEIRSSRGALIRRWTGGSLTAGVVKVGWDGTNGSGHRVAAGTYAVKVTGSAADGSGSLRRAFGSKHPLSWVAVNYPH